MAIIKCKMCGGDMELSPDKSYGTCEYCGSTMTLPKVDDEQRAAAFNRGNHFRRIGEFDKALAVYERIVQEDETDAEAHWCCALCRFGIEYVKDPATGEYLPTCHRASFDSFLEDVDYQAALKYADSVARSQYEKDGAKIAEVQRGILSISQKEQPFDVFICYKETDDQGRRTVDSTLAQDIYYQLTEQGRRVFFARITLEDKAGQEYEPYIFAALHSAKVMVVVGTRPEYLNAVWVKNEWSRFLSLMKKDRKKLLIPCYRDMDPYDLPEQLSVLQSYDMAKIGFIQDLIRGVAKVLDADKKPAAAPAAAGTGNANVASLLRRAEIFLEDQEWSSADEYFDKVLDIDPENAEAYLGKFCAEKKYRSINQITEGPGAPQRPSVAEGVLSLCNQGRKIEAIKFVREWTGMGLAEAKDAVEQVERSRGADVPADLIQIDPAKVSMSQENQKSLGKVKPQKLEACPMDTQRIDAAVEKYQAPPFVQPATIREAMEAVERSYDSEAAWYSEKLEKERQSLVQNKLLSRAVRYAKGDLAAQLADVQRKLQDAAQAQLDEVKRQDEERRKQAAERYAERLGEVEEKFAQLHQEARKTQEEGYAQACESMEANRDKQCQSVEQMRALADVYKANAKLLRDLGPYKDCAERIRTCESEAERWTREADKEVARLQREEAELRAREQKEAEERAAEEAERQRVIQAKLAAQRKLRNKKIGIIAAIAVVVIAAAALVTTKLIIPSGEYGDAEELLSQGNTIAAYKAFTELGGFRDSEQRAADLAAEQAMLPFAVAQPGELVTCGSYEQDGNTDNGPEPVEWVVVARDETEGRVLALSRYILDAQPYLDNARLCVGTDTETAAENSTYYMGSFDMLWREAEAEEYGSVRLWLKQVFAPAAFADDTLLSSMELISATELREGLLDISSPYLPTEYTPHAAQSVEEGEKHYWIRRATAEERARADMDLFIQEDGTVAFEGEGPVTATYNETEVGTSVQDAEEILGVRPAMWVVTDDARAAELAQARAGQEEQYDAAMALYESGDYQAATEAFNELRDYRDSMEMTETCRGMGAETQYQAAVDLMDSGDYLKAIAAFAAMDGYGDSEANIQRCAQALAQQAVDAGDYQEAMDQLRKVGDEEGALEIAYAYVSSHKDAGDAETQTLIRELYAADYKDSKTLFYELFPVSVEIFFNGSSEDLATRMTTINYKTTMSPWVHFDVTGGLEGIQPELRIVHENQWGTDGVVQRDFEVKEDEVSQVEYGVDTYWISHTGSNIYYHRYTIYNAITGEQLAQETLYTPYR